MSEPRDHGLRIGDAEREAAIGALGEHLSAGRLTMDEYGERTAKATTARTNEQLRALFADLPAPHPAAADPRKGREIVKSGPLAPTTDTPAPARRAGHLAPRIVRGLGAVSFVGWLALLVTGHGNMWWLVFVPVIFFVFASQVWPEEKKKS
ncbi:DUF1707 SHOCT-like domain-containing protein [Fodinicola acaciae]|uniref:DUF1707 SHOCT-like domain-containing protein n=1 Tax=Fodinicola acaciae TaxID=2681555 RepID=UPI001C9E707D|nr:DUF1707 domain-containing protein [Fodinicola acaciae]